MVSLKRASLPLRAAKHFCTAGTQTRSFSCSAARASSSSITAQDAASRLIESFADKSVTRRQFIDGNQLQKLALTLGRPTLGDGDIDVSELPPPDGTPVPPGYHLVYFTPNGVESELGADGTDRTFNAPAPFTRRMWAGGKMKWPAAASGDVGSSSPLLRVGDEVEERTRLLSATPKKSKSAGEMVLVEVEKEIWGPRGLAMVDQRSWVFRPEVNLETAVAPPSLTGVDVDVRGPSLVKEAQDENGFPARQLRWSPVGLFRFSALTFNGHKIHYNEDWTRMVESHPGLVVHGPLNLISILDYWRDVHGQGEDPHAISYRAMSPVYAGETYQIRTNEVMATDEGRLWEVVAEKGGKVLVKGEITAK